MQRLACLLALAAFQYGCKCAKKTDHGPVPRPPTVHAWAGLAHLDETLQNTSALASKFGLPAPGKDALEQAFARESGLGAAAVAEFDLGKPVWTASVKKEGEGAAYAQVYAFPLRDEKRFRDALGKEVEITEQKGVLKLTPKSGGGTKSSYAVISRGHAAVCREAAPLEVASDFLLGNLATSPAEGDLNLTLTQDFIAGWQTGITEVADRQGPPIAGIVRRLAGRAASVKEVNLRANIAATEVVVRLRMTADGGPMQALIKRQQTGPVYAADVMPSDSWLFVADRHSAESLAEMSLDIKEAIAKAPMGMAKEISQAAADLTTTLQGRVAVAISRSTILASARVKDPKTARAAVDALVAGFSGPNEVRRDGDYAIVELPAGIIPPLMAGRPEIGSYVRGDQLLFAAGIGAEDALRAMVEMRDGPALNKNAAFAKAAKPNPHRVGLLYISVAQMLSAMLAAVPGAPAREASPDTPGVVLEWGVDEKRTAMEVTLRAPADAFATLGPLLQSMPFMGRGRPMPGAPWKPSP